MSSVSPASGSPSLRLGYSVSIEKEHLGQSSQLARTFHGEHNTPFPQSPPRARKHENLREEIGVQQGAQGTGLQHLQIKTLAQTEPSC